MIRTGTGRPSAARLRRLLAILAGVTVLAAVAVLVPQHLSRSKSHAAQPAPTSRPTTSAPTTSPTPTIAPSGSTAAEPHVVGNQLMDRRTGLPFTPRGVDWSSFEYACTQGWGYSALDTLGSAATTTVAAALHSWGVNTVRLPLNEDCWLGTRGAPVSDASTARTSTGYRQEVHTFVDALHARGIAVILDLQSRKLVGSDAFGNYAMPDTDAVAFWGQVATEYRGDPSVMFDAFNEPNSRPTSAGGGGFTLSWQCWRDGGCQVPDVDDATPLDGRTYPAVGMATIVTTIRADGAAQPILLGGLDYANDLSEWLHYAPADPQLVAAFHTYDFTSCSTPTCWDAKVAVLAQSVPVITSELGANQPLDGYVAKYLTWATSHRIGVLFWVWGNTDASPMSLTTDETGDPTQYGLLAQNWLRSP
ncbi:cellulase family glycosylhydrolase [Jatrophihabitans sp.]|uniref:cellulase family glycosylhydrolase n=1 Tax=Jatrophihabitans sp. TaxID=1932789 RepID=UPI0030C74681|nr:glycoside hydrolase, family 5 [Jatrophihabitans sp.]